MSFSRGSLSKEGHLKSASALLAPAGNLAVSSGRANAAESLTACLPITPPLGLAAIFPTVESASIAGGFRNGGKRRVASART